MKRAVIFALFLVATGASLAGENYDLPRSKAGIAKCGNRIHERYGPNVQLVTQKTSNVNTLVEYYISMPNGEGWMLTCHPASGKLVVTGHRP